MTEPKRPGLDEAIEAAARRCYDLELQTVRVVIQIAYPIIAAAVRADERAKVLAEVARTNQRAEALAGRIVEARRALLQGGQTADIRNRQAIAALEASP